MNQPPFVLPAPTALRQRSKALALLDAIFGFSGWQTFFEYRRNVLGDPTQEGAIHYPSTGNGYTISFFNEGTIICGRGKDSQMSRSPRRRDIWNRLPVMFENRPWSKKANLFTLKDDPDASITGPTFAFWRHVDDERWCCCFENYWQDQMFLGSSGIPVG